LLCFRDFSRTRRSIQDAAFSIPEGVFISRKVNIDFVFAISSFVVLFVDSSTSRDSVAWSH
jgi:hypothetical protein